MSIHHWLGSLRAQNKKIHHRLARCALAPIMGGLSFLQQFSNIHHRFCLSIRFCSLRSPGSRCIPMVNARFPPLGFCLHDSFLLVPRLTTLKTCSVSSFGPSHPSTSEIQSFPFGIPYIFFSILWFTLNSCSASMHPTWRIFTPPRIHRPAALIHPSRKTDSPTPQPRFTTHSSIDSPTPTTDSSRLRFTHRQPLFTYSQPNC